MHSVTLDSSGSPRKRTFSRGLSEDESLRSIIKETESSSRRLARSDSRAGTLKRRSDSQSDQDLFMGLPEMLELQASYDEVVQELRGLEVEREALLFQVDVLQDTLEGVEELLAEAQREAGQASLELEREREAKRKLESMVSALMQEVERLKEERNNQPSPPVNTHGCGDEATRQGHQMKNDAKEQSRAARTEEKDSSLCEPHSSESRRRGSEEAGQDKGAEDEGGVLTKLRKMVNKPLCHIPSLALDNPLSEDGVHQRPYENCIEDGRDPSPDRNDSDDVSAYEDASADTPEQDKIFPGDGDLLELPSDSENKEKSPTNNCQGNDGETQEPKNPDSCVVS
ncbi:leucine-rich repeat flightless-interacting protein 2 isoform X5 [Lates calcarifer]|uniref:Leucine-rich repeat flightless-interacting protein 2 isoform X4 n=1 Tax=Lates calcarifer TaxID=8187 RepID=A0AAJ8BCP6_LATCA|nr:leucine-rich repeat flightless-interacting protein 2 isoform X4 [Lates calcarifer]XP_050930421.1 leucine-rich repeat flightless-interacting protein 2 isoform X5 [Lates calcarifer]